MRAQPAIHHRTSPAPRPAAGGEPGAARLVAELMIAGLVSVEVGDDGDIGFALTPSGQKVARQMAMGRDDHALVLLGALIRANHGLD